MIRVLVLLILWGLSGEAWAICLRPNGVEGEMIYNKDQKLVQYCDGTRWIGVGWKRSSVSAVGDDGAVQFVRDGKMLGDTDLMWDTDNKVLQVRGVLKVDKIEGNNCADRVKFAPAMTYGALNTALSSSGSGGAAVCGAGWHVCNAPEVWVNGIVFGCTNSSFKWIVGGFSSAEFHRRSIWNGQDSVQCAAGNYPTWYSDTEGYRGLIHCQAQGNSLGVACCRN